MSPRSLILMYSTRAVVDSLVKIRPIHDQRSILLITRVVITSRPYFPAIHDRVSQIIVIHTPHELRTRNYRARSLPPWPSAMYGAMDVAGNPHRWRYFVRHSQILLSDPLFSRDGIRQPASHLIRESFQICPSFLVSGSIRNSLRLHRSFRGQRGPTNSYG